MVPECLLVVIVLFQLWVLSLHQLHDGLGTLQALLSVGQLASQLNHLLDFTSVFRHHQLLALGVVI